MRYRNDGPTALMLVSGDGSQVAGLEPGEEKDLPFELVETEQIVRVDPPKSKMKTAADGAAEPA